MSSNPISYTKRRNRRQKHKKNLSGDGPSSSASSSPNAGAKCVADSKTALNIQNGDHKKQKQPLHVSLEELNMGAPKNAANARRNNNCRRAAAGQEFENWRALNRENALETGESVAQLQEPNEENAAPQQSRRAFLRRKRRNAARNRYVAMDCEMVGIGQKGHKNMLARVSIVNKYGKVLLDKFVKPCAEVTDYRTSVSGIRPHNIANGENFDTVQDEVLKLIQGKILVGHALYNDLAVLHIKHPYTNIRDTARYRPLSELVTNGRTPSLKKLAKVILGVDIQDGEHDSVEDARAAMKVYNNLSIEWEKYHQMHLGK